MSRYLLSTDSAEVSVDSFAFCSPQEKTWFNIILGLAWHNSDFDAGYWIKIQYIFIFELIFNICKYFDFYCTYVIPYDHSNKINQTFRYFQSITSTSN